MIAPSFPVPTLGANAYRPSYFARRLREQSGPQFFVTLLRQVAPSRFRALESRTPLRCYIALLEELSHRFPINEYYAVMAQEIGEHGDEDNPYMEGIPFDVFGIDPYDDEITSPAVALCALFGMYARDPDELVHGAPRGIADCLDPLDFAWADALAPLLGRSLRHLLHPPYELRTPPRGRVWRAPWQRLYALYACANCMTDNPFLDFTHSEQEESEAFPPWNLDEIRALERLWKEAVRVTPSADALSHYIDARPRERLPLLAGALRRDRDILLQLTQPKDTTLKKIFAMESSTQ